jgi:signal transduction histidine kinase
MSKETAHQLGTPISSLMAWTELLKEMTVDPSIPTEIGKDVHRLETIAQRFSKIGSVPVLEDTDIVPIIDDFTNYLQTRISSMVKIHFDKPDHPIILPLNQQLFEWVIENLCKNSADAMNGKGDITISITEDKNKVYIDVTDTGKGIPPKMQRRIFSPGYTSKSRGWGLGLTLAKRIIQNYHKGKLFVKSSVIDQGTTMRIQLKAK